MEIDIQKITKDLLIEYKEISIAFEGNSVLEVVSDFPFEVKLIEKEVEPFAKDFDKGEEPEGLIRKFDLENWRMITLRDDSLIAGAILAYDTDGINMLEGRKDLVVVWDIRVDTDYRGQGLGTKLFNVIKEWATKNNCSEIKVESQNNNVSACKFYASLGGTISNLNKNKYIDHPNEVQIIWSYKLGGQND